MPGPFAALEDRVNAAVEARLSNALASFNGGEAFGVVFDRLPVQLIDGYAESAGPEASFDIARAPGLAHGSVLVIDGVGYSVTGGLEPDRSGWVTVQLRKA
ncbi:hypothetical protein ABL850_14765 [Variovorax paradoxus]|uniref:head-tail joining protein n=1 Tax=Variovorax paradoxus TaxID=34073 RepID=UPI0003F5FAF3